MKKVITLCLMFLMFVASVSAQGLKGFKLANGMTVYVWEDDTKSDVFGMVGVKVGAVDDPTELTGLAHYLEHMMFKGTQKISALDWEKEKPLYEQIIAKYDEKAKESDPAKKKALDQEINKLTIEASKYAAPNEFSILTENMGGKDLNAATGYDMTMYFSSFPPSQLYRWLELNSERFINPVFRSFQPELETVYEEFNRSQDNRGRLQQEFVLKHIFPGHPYSRSILGLQEHLKDPRLGGLVDFYNQWYVPENMVLVLVGNVKMREAQGLINNFFGRFPAKESPKRAVYPEVEIKGRTEYTEKLADYPTLGLAYKGVSAGADDQLALEVCSNILSNRDRTGLFDKLTLDGNIMAAAANLMSFKDQGRILIYGIPAYDVNQRRFESLKGLEKMLLEEIKKLQSGNIEDWRFNSVISSMMRDFDLSFESSQTKAQMIMQAFINNEDIANVLNYKERLMAISLDKVKEISKKYFSDNYIVFNFQQGKPTKAEKLSKPSYEPINPPRDVVSEYAKTFAKLPVKKVEPRYTNFADVQIKPLNKRSKLFYTPNKENNVFSLTLKYGVGTREMPKLNYATALMESAGVMGAFDPQQLKQEFSALGAVCNFSVDENYLTITMTGYEENLAAACQLLSRQILMPQLDEKQLNQLIGSVYQSRMLEEDNSNVLESSLYEYMRYKEESEYIKRMSIQDILGLTISNLTGEFNRATDYEAEVHYVGALPFDNAYDILSKNLPLKADEKATTSPQLRDRVKYDENTVYFISDKDAIQSKIYFYVEGDAYNPEEAVYYNAFNKYMGSGFGGLVMQEIREFRSMAYTADGAYISPYLKDKNSYFMGYIGTQADKTVEAIDIFMKLITEMPEYPERISNIKDYLKETLQTSEPSFRVKSLVIEAWKRLGYTEDPAKSKAPVVEGLTFDDVVKFYQNKLKGRPVAIGIIGDPKRVNLKELEKFGKLVRINKSKLFSEE